MFTRRQTIAVIFTLLLLAAAAFFTVNAPMPPGAATVSSVMILLFAAPAFFAARRWLGFRDAILLFAALGILGLAIETFAIATGYPYGQFQYSDKVGVKLFGLTPWTVAFAWTPLLLAAYAVARKLAAGIFVRLPLIALLTVVFDLVLDPGSVRLGFWAFDAGGAYYGVPLSNYFGWLISGLIGAGAIELFVRYRKPLLPVPVQLTGSAFLTIFFWMCVALFAGLALPLAIGAAAIIFLVWFYRAYHYAFDDMIVYVDENNVPLGTARKLPAHDGDTRRHRAFSVFIFNRNGELLLQQRALTKKTWPGVWSNSACGHVMLHESVKDAAKRRVRFELGMSGIRLQTVLPDFRYRAEKDGVVENEICPVLVGFTDSLPRPNPAEVNRCRWADWRSFVAEVTAGNSDYSPWAVEEVRLLAGDPEFNRQLGEYTGAPANRPPGVRSVESTQ